ncbi:MAG: MerR family transcriptional regulator [Gemmatimonadota bacterium]
MILSMNTLTVGQLARQAGVNLETVRYYERRALLAAPSRTASGYRQYPASTVRRIEFIKRAQALGFTLDEIADLLALQSGTPKQCAAVEREASTVVARIDQKLGELTRMRAALGQLVEACRTRKNTSECPLLDALAPEKDETE